MDLLNSFKLQIITTLVVTIQCQQLNIFQLMPPTFTHHGPGAPLQTLRHYQFEPQLPAQVQRFQSQLPEQVQYQQQQEQIQAPAPEVVPETSEIPQDPQGNEQYQYYLQVPTIEITLAQPPSGSEVAHSDDSVTTSTSAPTTSTESETTTSELPEVTTNFVTDFVGSTTTEGSTSSPSEAISTTTKSTTTRKPKTTTKRAKTTTKKAKTTTTVTTTTSPTHVPRVQSIAKLEAVKLMECGHDHEQWNHACCVQEGQLWVNHKHMMQNQGFMLRFDPGVYTWEGHHDFGVCKSVTTRPFIFQVAEPRECKQLGSFCVWRNRQCSCGPQFVGRETYRASTYELFRHGAEKRKKL